MKILLNFKSKNDVNLYVARFDVFSMVKIKNLLTTIRKMDHPLKIYIIERLKIKYEELEIMKIVKRNSQIAPKKSKLHKFSTGHPIKLIFTPAGGQNKKY